jgi:leader peptidase (prepilin peptidase)/N-methyltransferase
MTSTLVVVFGAVLGACLGSFASVVAWRTPRHESIVRPGSYCPNCRSPLRPVDLVPILSWAAHRGRSRCCGAHIPLRYPVLEVTGALASGIVAALLVH